MVANAISPAVLSYTPPHPPLKEFTPARDRAFFADPTKASLFAEASAVEEVTPHIGTELKGVQLSILTDAQKDELALLVAEVRAGRMIDGLKYFANRGREAWYSSVIRISHLTSNMISRRTMVL